MGCHLLQPLTLHAPHWAPTCRETTRLGSRLLPSLEVGMREGVHRPTPGTPGWGRGRQTAVCSVHHPSSDSALSTPSGPGSPARS